MPFNRQQLKQAIINNALNPSLLGELKKEIEEEYGKLPTIEPELIEKIRGHALMSLLHKTLTAQANSEYELAHNNWLTVFTYRMVACPKLKISKEDWRRVFGRKT